MSSAGIIVAIAIILSTLVCGAFIAQTMQQRREQRNRLLAALRAKSRRFKMILAGCPQGFLSRDLTILVLQSLIDSNEKLSRLEPSQVTHLQDVTVYSEKLSEIQSQTSQPTAAPITNPVQIQELKACLEELGRYIANLESKQTIPAKQANILKAQIKYLMIKLAIDLNEMQARAAQENDKFKLAIHHYQLAFDMIVKTAKGSPLQAKLPIYEEKIKQLNEQLAKQNDENNQSHDSIEQSIANQHEWDNFGKADNSWKKKTDYD